MFQIILCDYDYYLLQLSNYPFSELFYVTTVIVYSSILSPWLGTLEQCADNLDLAVLQKSKNWVWPQMAVVKTSKNLP
jgi:hypothetical protein